MAEEYKLHKRVIEENGFEVKEGVTFTIELDGQKIEAKIKKIDEDQVIAVSE